MPSTIGHAHLWIDEIAAPVLSFTPVQRECETLLPGQNRNAAGCWCRLSATDLRPASFFRLLLIAIPRSRRRF